MPESMRIVDAVNELVDRLIEQGEDTDLIVQALLLYAMGMRVGSGATFDDFRVEVDAVVDRAEDLTSGKA